MRYPLPSPPLDYKRREYFKSNILFMELSEAAKNLKPGVYEHFKGGRYEVIGVTHHSETLEEMVLYKHLDDSPSIGLGQSGLWVRPLVMFTGTVERDGKIMPRFKYIE